MTAAGDGSPAYVAAVLTLYLDLPDTPLRPSPVDQSLASRLHQQAVPLLLVESALLLATTALQACGPPAASEDSFPCLFPAGHCRTAAAVIARRIP